jgi:hypothetical protein
MDFSLDEDEMQEDSELATIAGSYQGLQASAPAASSVGEVDWSGRTYFGNWQSRCQDSAVTVTTTAPVVIENATIRSVGSLIKTTIAGSNLTVRNSLGVAENLQSRANPTASSLKSARPPSST